MDGAKEDLVDMFIVHTTEEIQVLYLSYFNIIALKIQCTRLISVCIHETGCDVIDRLFCVSTKCRYIHLIACKLLIESLVLH